MGFKLINEVKEWLPGAPPTLGAPERLALWAIAERANDGSREAWPSPRWDLASILGVQPNGLARILQRLAAAGLEARVQRGTDARGRPVYAHRGAQTTYRLPALNGSPSVPPNDGNGRPTGQPFNPGKGGPQARHSNGERLAQRPGMAGPQAQKAGPQARNAWPTGQPFSSSPDGSSNHQGLGRIVPRTAARRGTPDQPAPQGRAEAAYVTRVGAALIDAFPKIGLSIPDAELVASMWLAADRQALDWHTSGQRPDPQVAARYCNTADALAYIDGLGGDESELMEWLHCCETDLWGGVSPGCDLACCGE
ncbi:cyclic nucleotide-binding domain-containing protein [Micromonospora chersina]|uniref:hypothetical protein n=1 Tax=Micromonospora chersina TaxID=47854 RepID=UPI003715906B